MTDPYQSGSPRKELGLMETAKAVMMTPTSFFENAPEERSSYTPVGFAVVIGALSSAAAEVVNALFTGGSVPAVMLAGAIRGGVLGFFGTYAGAAILHLFLRFVLRTGQPFKSTLASVGYASAALVVAIVPFAGGLAAIVWKTILTVIGLRATHRASLAAVVSVVLVTMTSPVLLALGLRAFVLEAFKIPAMSMAPTLWNGDHIFVNKAAYGFFSKGIPERGDVVVFPFPENPKQDFVKRVIGLPGDNIELVEGRPVINGFTPPHCRVGTIDVSGREMTVFVEHLGRRSYLTMFDVGAEGGRDGPYQVKPGEVFMLGDNRYNSHDSRRWNGGVGGGVPIDTIRGRAAVWFAAFDPGRSIYDRSGDDIHGLPLLPERYQSQLAGPLSTCMSSRPPISDTTPPNP
jgi:signal peptidase I